VVIMARSSWQRRGPLRAVALSADSVFDARSSRTMHADLSHGLLCAVVRRQNSFASIKQALPRNSDGGDLLDEDVTPVAPRDS
jgi:hypothetical protein